MFYRTCTIILMHPFFRNEPNLLQKIFYRINFYIALISRNIENHKYIVICFGIYILKSNVEK